MTRVLRFHQHGTIDNLVLEEIPNRDPVGDEVLIKVDAFALNRADIMFIDGDYTTSAILPSRLGSEVSGTVMAVGADVTRVVIGDRVGTIPFPGNNTYGVQGETALVPEYVVTPTPVGLSSEEATSIWMQYLTAYFAFCEKVTLSAADVVFISAASSSAGLGAIQLGKLLGVTTVAATRTPDKVDFLTDAGADHVIISDEEDVATRLLDITAGQGVRVAYDPVSGAYVGRYIGGMSAHGLIILYGSLEKDRQLPHRQLVQKAINCYYYSMYNHVMDTAQLARGKALIYGGIAIGQLRPIIDRVFPLDQFREAYRHLLSNTQTGKIVVSVE